MPKEQDICRSHSQLGISGPKSPTIHIETGSLCTYESTCAQPILWPCLGEVVTNTHYRARYGTASKYRLLMFVEQLRAAANENQHERRTM
jgi:hypothetical protein